MYFEIWKRKLDFPNLCELVLEAGRLQDKNKTHFLNEQDWICPTCRGYSSKGPRSGRQSHQAWKLGWHSPLGICTLSSLWVSQVSQGPLTHPSPQSAWMSWSNSTRPMWRSIMGKQGRTVLRSSGIWFRPVYKSRLSFPCSTEVATAQGYWFWSLNATCHFTSSCQMTVFVGRFLVGKKLRFSKILFPNL